MRVHLEGVGSSGAAAGAGVDPARPGVSAAAVARRTARLVAGRPDAGVADPDAREQNIAKLTPRERDVIRQLVHGKSNKEIARILSIEDGTVKQHLNSAFTKLGVTNRTQAAIAIANVKL